ncbi:MAG: tyrosine-type recombinase/integrase [Nitrososphaerota archaeon]
MFKGIKNLYLIKGKLVFRAHIRKNGQDKHVWKVIGRPEEFSEEELRLIVKKFLSEVWKKEDESNNSNRVKFQKEVLSDQVDINSSSHLKELIEKFLLWYKETRRTSSYRRYKEISSIILKFFKPYCPVSKIDLVSVEDYKIWRQKQRVSLVTINKELRFLSTLINRAVEFKWIQDHELYRRPILIRGVKSERLRYLSEKEERRLLKAIKNPLLKDIVIFALNTGLRKSEILNLKWDEVDLRLKCIILGSEKTKSKRKHILPLNQKALEVIKRRLKEKRKGCPYVFHRSGKEIKCFKEAFKNALKRAKIKDFHFHDLRHTFASRLVQKGVDLYVVKHLLNHADITTTQRYAHLRLDNMRKAVEML